MIAQVSSKENNFFCVPILIILGKQAWFAPCSCYSGKVTFLVSFNKVISIFDVSQDHKLSFYFCILLTVSWLPGLWEPGSPEHVGQASLWAEKQRTHLRFTVRRTVRPESIGRRRTPPLPLGRQATVLSSASWAITEPATSLSLQALRRHLPQKPQPPPPCRYTNNTVPILLTNFICFDGFRTCNF